MTHSEARDEARRRWGAEVVVEFQDYIPNLDPNKICFVSCLHDVPCDPPRTHEGREVMTMCEKHWGEGPTWEDAFADADRRAGKQGER